MDWHIILEFLSIIIIPFTGWLYNIQKEHNKQLQDLKEEVGKRVTYARFDEFKDYGEKNMVRKSDYDTANFYKDKAIDEKFTSMLHLINTQFQNLEDKIDDLQTALKEANNNNNHNKKIG